MIYPTSTNPSPGMPERETIEAAAIMFEGKLYTLPRPNRHHNIIHLIYNETGKQVPGDATQGFVTSSGRFATRYQAHRIAHKAKQPCKRPISHGSELYSEDLW